MADVLSKSIAMLIKNTQFITYYCTIFIIHIHQCSINYYNRVSNYIPLLMLNCTHSCKINHIPAIINVDLRQNQNCEYSQEWTIFVIMLDYG